MDDPACDLAIVVDSLPPSTLFESIQIQMGDIEIQAMRFIAGAIGEDKN